MSAVGVASPGGNAYSEMPNDLPSLERLCEQLYTAQDGNIRKQAESVLIPLSTSTTHLPKCLMILDNSTVRGSILLIAEACNRCIEILLTLLSCNSCSILAIAGPICTKVRHMDSNKTRN